MIVLAPFCTIGWMDGGGYRRDRRTFCPGATFFAAGVFLVVCCGGVELNGGLGSVVDLCSWLWGRERVLM